MATMIANYSKVSTNDTICVYMAAAVATIPGLFNGHNNGADFRFINFLLK